MIGCPQMGLGEALWDDWVSANGIRGGAERTWLDAAWIVAVGRDAIDTHARVVNM